MPQFRAGQRLTVDLMNLLTQAPAQSDQVADPPFNATTTWTDFLEASFPSLDIDIPDGARLRIIVSGRAANSNTSNSTCYLSWRASGANTIAGEFDSGVGGGGGSTAVVRASNVSVTNALVGGVTTITPQWYISSGTSATASLQNCHLIVEVIP